MAPDKHFVEERQVEVLAAVEAAAAEGGQQSSNSTFCVGDASAASVTMSGPALLLATLWPALADRAY